MDNQTIEYQTVPTLLKDKEVEIERPGFRWETDIRCNVCEADFPSHLIISTGMFLDQLEKFFQFHGTDCAYIHEIYEMAKEVEECDEADKS